MVDVVVLNYNDALCIKEYVSTICDYKSIGHIIIVDNNSTDDSYEKLLSLKSEKIDVIKSSKNGGYGYGNNVGIRFAVGTYNSKTILVSNPDVKYTENCLLECEKFLKEKEGQGYGIVAPRMQNTNLTFVKNAWNLSSWFNYARQSLYFYDKIGGKRSKLNYVDNYCTCDCVAGSFLMIDTKKFLDIGLYDEKIFLYCEETVVGLRMKKMGYKTAILTNESFIHAHSVSISKIYRKEYKKKKLLWESREYVLKEYYHIGPFKRFLVKIIKAISLFEMRMIDIIKHS